MDHLVVINENSPIIVNRDWYGAHARLTEELGPRILEEGAETRWLFSIDPLTMDGGYLPFPERYLRVRTNDPYLDKVIRKISSHSLGEQEVPAAGERVRFYITLSAKDPQVKYRSADGVRRKVEVARDDLHVVRDRNKVIKNISSAGLDIDETTVRVHLPRLLHIQKSPRKYTIPAIRAKGEALVSDVAILKEALKRGVGRDRAFGCGILVVEKIGDM